MFQSPQSDLNWDDIVDTEKQQSYVTHQQLDNTKQQLQYQLDQNYHLQSQFNQTLRNMSSLSPYKSYSDQKMQEYEDVYNNYSDEESNQQKYMNKIIQKYGKKTQKRTQKRVCEKHEIVDYPFKPQTNALPQDLYNKETSQISKEEIWGRLLQNKREMLEEREQLKRQEMNEQVLISQKQFYTQCTFNPQISEVSKQIVEQKYSNLENVEDRLYREAMELKKKKEFQFLQKNDEEKFTFKPDISVSILKGDKACLKPLYERIDEVMKKRQQDLHMQKVELENNHDNTFKPNINQKSNWIAEQKINTKSVVDRLVQDAFEKVQRRNQDAQSCHKKLSDECTFNPSINPVIKDDDEEQGIEQQKFVNKQYMMADFLKEKREKLISDFMKKENFTFKPNINKQSELLVEADPDRVNEDMETKYQRLYQRDMEKQQILKEQLKEAYYKQFSFKPKINQISSIIGKQVGGKSDVNDLASNKLAEERLKQKKEQLESEQLQQYSFYPSTIKNNQYQHVQSNYKVDKLKQGIEEQEMNKKKKVQSLQKYQEYQELKECTFKPSIKKNELVKDQQKLNEKIKGLDTFMQNKENFKRQQQLKEEREKEVFNYEERYNNRKNIGETKSLPFKLSQGNPNHMRVLQQEAIERERQECTFNPKTNEKYKVYA